MPLFIEKPVIISLQVEIKPDARSAFVDWQADFNAKIASTPGFVSLEFSSPFEQQKSWLIVQRFISPEASTSWRNGGEYGRLIDKLQTLTVDKEIKESDELGKTGNITEVIVTEVSPGMEKNFRAWCAKIHQIEAKFPGFRGVYIQSPKGQGRHWITLLQFDTMENLDCWLQSPERKQALQDSSSLISSLESHRVISPYAGWFASIAKTGELPSVWKQTMLVLLVLFPIVVLELRFLSPLTASLNRSFGTFIGNALSVMLISFPMMPIAIWFLGWWLSTDSLKTTIRGTLLVGLLYLAEIALFWNFM
jgi:antibiotic biosynthesis monooxygenase (ABM) superfamily enzyme